MNTDIRISTDFFLHPKTEMLEKRLGPKGVLCLIKLWIWAAQTRPDGVLGKKTCEYVAAAAKWKGDCHKFVDALLELELLDQDDDGVLSLHNWCKRQPYAIKSDERVERARKAAAARWGNDNGNKQDAHINDSTSKENTDSGNTHNMPSACQENASQCQVHTNSNAKNMLSDANGMPPTQPNQTEVQGTSEDPPNPQKGDGSEGQSPLDVAELSPEQPKRKRIDYRRKDFEDWKTKYGMKVDDDRLWKVWKKQIHKIPEQAVLMAALDRYQQSKRWQDGYRKDPDNYLRGCCWNDDFTPAQPPRRYYGPDANGRTPYVREDEQDFSNVPRDANGGVDWAQVMGGAK